MLELQHLFVDPQIFLASKIDVHSVTPKQHVEYQRGRVTV